ncbi:MAG TPA: class I SAM-dependent methyltransferase [Solirubrobacteraceae bacterium]|nr:class I SAM-dependent methyltransferase [Solirubrobacteraceae bacterium]
MINPTDSPPTTGAQPEHDEMWDLENLRAARRLCDWMYAQSSRYVRGNVAEIGAGIGTFSERLAASRDVDSLLLIEPEPACVQELRRVFGASPNVTVVAETLPDSPTLRARAGTIDFVLCQNVLEHIDDEQAAVRAMADSLRPGGNLALLVPANPRLYGSLDRAYGHYRRYTRARVQKVLASADLEIIDLYSFNLLGVPGWWVNRHRRSPGLSRGSLRAYEALLRLWQPVEDWRRPPWGLSVIAHARRRAG